MVPQWHHSEEPLLVLVRSFILLSVDVMQATEFSPEEVSEYSVSSL